MKRKTEISYFNSLVFEVNVGQFEVSVDNSLVSELLDSLDDLLKYVNSLLAGDFFVVLFERPLGTILHIQILLGRMNWSIVVLKLDKVVGIKGILKGFHDFYFVLNEVHELLVLDFFYGCNGGFGEHRCLSNLDCVWNVLN